jgi:hypothetical protein
MLAGSVGIGVPVLSGSTGIGTIARANAGMALVVIIGSRPDPKDCRHPIDNPIRIGKICGLCGKDPV